MQANRKQESTVILMVGEERGGVLDQAATGTNRPVRSAVLANREQA
jgi:hypothetical protein